MSDGHPRAMLNPGTLAFRWVGILLGTSAYASALSYFAGWQFGRAYLSQWGIPFRSVEFGPADVVLFSVYPILAGLTIAITTLYVIQFLRTEVRDPLKGGIAATLVASAAAVVAFSERNSPLGSQATLVCLSAFAFVGVNSLSWAPSSIRNLVLGYVALITWVAVAYFPTSLGAARARETQADPSSMALAELTLTRHLGLPLEREECGLIKSGPWRIVEVGAGALWVAVDKPDTSDAFGIRAEEVLSVHYIDRAKTVQVDALCSEDSSS